MWGCHKPYLPILTHNLALSGSSRLLSRYPLPLLRLQLCSTWSFIMASRARQAIMIVKTAPASPFIRDITRGKSWKIKLFQKPVERIATESFIDHIFMQFFCSSWRHFTWGNLLPYCLLHIWTPRYSLKVLQTQYISSASVMLECWQTLSKLTYQRVYQILVYRNDLLLSLPTGVLLLPLAAFSFIFSRAVFCAMPWLIEHLEETTKTTVFVIVEKETHFYRLANKR